MSDIVMGYVAEILAADAFLALDAGTWNVNLFTNVYTPVPSSTPADFTAPSYTGYATQPTGGWAGAAIDGLGNATAAGLGSLPFQPTANTGLPETIRGWWLDDGAGNYLFGALLPYPFVMVDMSSVLTLIPSYTQGQLA